MKQILENLAFSLVGYTMERAIERNRRAHFTLSDYGDAWYQGAIGALASQLRTALRLSASPSLRRAIGRYMRAEIALRKAEAAQLAA